MANVTRPSIQWVGALHYDQGRGGYAPEVVVLHTMGGTLAGCDDWFNRPECPASAHYGVGRHGEIHEYVAPENTAWANGIIEAGWTARVIRDNPSVNPNKVTLSIEHDDLARGALPTEAQLEASARLCAWLFAAYLLPGGASGVAIDEHHIIRHADISPQSRTHCPGWPPEMLTAYIARVRALVNGESGGGQMTDAQAFGIAIDMEQGVAALSAAVDAATRARQAATAQDDAGAQSALSDLHDRIAEASLAQVNAINRLAS